MAVVAVVAAGAWVALGELQSGTVLVVGLGSLCTVAEVVVSAAVESPSVDFASDTVPVERATERLRNP